ncbi:DUF917 domain-containing protein [Calorimonas adulescens]|jgi:Protein of unknown function (DUF917).|uniref:DUF917 family protein n=1 Tax=Calorimonas adulescens TaxID=2606906 RepID=A0A5D8QCN5_9THEO|nr:DUF917 family protein [Calorimonas adulescens]TZE82292.1 DUF917 family protein [Calorimonas adulescens]
MVIDYNSAESMVNGGSVLGGGGGGSKELGLRIARLAVELGTIKLIDIDDLPSDAVLITASAVGAPAAGDAYIEPSYQLKAFELLEDIYQKKIDGIIVNEMGGLSIANGWILSAATGIPIVDAPCNGRAHPTGVMGSMGLNRVNNYESIQVAVGGSHEKNNYIELLSKGSIDKCSSMVRYASVMAGGMVFVLRNPVKADYARENCAVGAMKQALRVGRQYARDKEVVMRINNVCTVLGGKAIDKATVCRKSLKTEGGFDSGYVELKSETKKYQLYFWNEYMLLESENERIATFPDLIVTFDSKDGEVINSADIVDGQEVYIVYIPQENLLLGSGVKDRELLKPIEEVTGKEVLKYLD